MIIWLVTITRARTRLFLTFLGVFTALALLSGCADSGGSTLEGMGFTNVHQIADSMWSVDLDKCSFQMFRTADKEVFYAGGFRRNDVPNSLVYEGYGYTNNGQGVGSADMIRTDFTFVQRCT